MKCNKYISVVLLISHTDAHCHSTYVELKMVSTFWYWAEQHNIVLHYSVSPHIQNKLSLQELHPTAQLIIKHTQNYVYGQT